VKKVVLSQDATDYLIQQANYLSERNPGAAAAFLRRMKQAFGRIAEFPEIGPPNDFGGMNAGRKLVDGDFVIFYDPGDIIAVSAIRHGRQLKHVVRLADDPDPEDADPERDAFPPANNQSASTP
jgi:plasmid stabilization system protein ParE